MKIKSFCMAAGVMIVALSICSGFIFVDIAQSGNDVAIGESATYEANLSFRKGEEAAKEKRWDFAISAFNKAIEQNPASVTARIRKGQAQAEAGHMNKALATLSVAVFIAPGSYDALFQRGRICIRMENYDQALCDFDKALHLIPGSAEAYYWRAWSLLKLGKVRAAFRDFDAAHRLNPKFPRPKLINDRQVHIPS